MTDRRITKKEFDDNGGHKNYLQYTTGCPVAGNYKYWSCTPKKG